MKVVGEHRRQIKAQGKCFGRNKTKTPIGFRAFAANTTRLFALHPTLAFGNGRQNEDFLLHLHDHRIHCFHPAALPFCGPPKASDGEGATHFDWMVLF